MGQKLEQEVISEKRESIVRKAKRKWRLKKDCKSSQKIGKKWREKAEGECRRKQSEDTAGEIEGRESTLRKQNEKKK